MSKVIEDAKQIEIIEDLMENPPKPTDRQKEVFKDLYLASRKKEENSRD